MALLGDPFHGQNLAALGFHSQHETTVDWAAIHQYGTRPAVPVVAALFGAGQPEHVAQNLQETMPRFAEELDGFTVDRTRDVRFLRHETDYREEYEKRDAAYVLSGTASVVLCPADLHVKAKGQRVEGLKGQFTLRLFDFRLLDFL